MKVKYTNYLKKLFYIEDDKLKVTDTFNGDHVGIASGHATVMKYDNNVLLHIFNLFTQEDHRNQGLASTILDEMTNYAKFLGCNMLHLYCKPELVNFYKKRGFVEYDKFEDHIEMVSRI